MEKFCEAARSNYLKTVFQVQNYSTNANKD